MLSIPHAFAAVGGPAAGALTLAATAAASTWSAAVIADAGRATGAPALRSIVGAVFGAVPAAVTDVAVCGALGVAAVSYVCGVVELGPLLVPALLGGWSRLTLVLATVAALGVPCLAGDLGAFGPTSAMAVGGCYLLSAALVVHLLGGLLGGGGAAAAGAPTLGSVAAALTSLRFSPAGVVATLPLMVFPYAFHYVLTDTLGELGTPTKGRLRAVIGGSVGTLTACYLPFGVAGALLYAAPGPVGTADGGASAATAAAAVPLNVLAGVGDGSLVVTVARAAIAALLALTYPLLLIPLRRRVETGLWGAPQPWGRRRAAAAAALSAAVGAAAAGLADLGAANDVAGGAIALIMFFIPGALSVAAGLDALWGGGGGGGAWPRIAAGVASAALGLLAALVGLSGLFP
ncbi:hypothetical protein BU14_0071s0005 [Porphyra umbilicalis]|uniref:Uncharacterized protein n=1 Tax=Porphyra umbilicalis TaxID=2786 RepID=A0A1X6PFX9_PORUM|nr:hypothetical protein BU14_0071s0005 [Porphyra umbilicalis]|eukprot:OSX79750.1 hypothetical protein BU14_0071s0005 [Porphyra umbilicalis]